MRYDNIVVGGGSAGCVLAARLSEDPARRVLLLEAGGAGDTLFHRMPAANGYLFNRPRYDWRFYSVPQPGLDGRRIYFPRGLGLGGTSAMNGMIYIRGNRRDYDLWRQDGLPGWGWDEVLPYFRRAEGSHRGDGPEHGAAGPLRTSRAANIGRMDEVFLQAAAEAGLPSNEDFNGTRQTGAGVYDLTVRDGRRMSTSATYLAAARGRPNLTVLPGAHALGIVFDGRRAAGVRYRHRGSEVVARADGDIVLALGAFGSPQLLMLSGIGPADALRRLGIAVQADLPSVGGNLQDHLDISVQADCTRPELSLARYQHLGRAMALALRYLADGGGPGGAPFWSVGAFAGGAPDEDWPAYQIFLTPMLVVENPEHAANRGWRPRWLDGDWLGRTLLVRGKFARAGFQLDLNLMRPASRGRITLASADPLAPPLIDPCFLAEPADLAAMIEAVRLGRRIFAGRAFDGLRGAELIPGSDVTSDAALAAFVRANATTGHHPVGTCRMGRDGDPGAVVDAGLKVIGVEGLRVADASVMPSIVTGNTNAPVIMIAEKASDLVRGRPAPSRSTAPRDVA